MKTIQAVSGRVLPLGRLGENEYTVVLFDVSEWVGDYPSASIGLYNQIPGGTAYPVVGANLTRSGSTVTLEQTDGRTILRESIGAFPDMTPEPEPVPEGEEE